MKKLYLFLGLIAGLFIGFAYSVHAAPCTPTTGGGTGICSTTSSTIGYVLTVSSSSPFIYTLSPSSGGGGSSTITYAGFGILVNASGTGYVVAVNSSTILTMASGTALYYPLSNPSGFTTTTIQAVLNSLSAAGCLTYSTSIGVFTATCLSTSTAATIYVPYTGANANVNLGSNNISAAIGNFSGNLNSSGTLFVNPPSGTNEQAQYLYNGSTTYFFVLNTGAGGYNPLTPAEANGLFYNASNTVDSPLAKFIIAPWSNTSSGIVLNNLGYLGIEQNNPVNPLDVSGSADVRNDLAIGTTTTSTATLVVNGTIAGNGTTTFSHANASGSWNYSIVNDGNYLEVNTTGSIPGTSPVPYNIILQNCPPVSTTSTAVTSSSWECALSQAENFPDGSRSFVDWDTEYYPTGTNPNIASGWFDNKRGTSSVEFPFVLSWNDGSINHVGFSMTPATNTSASNFNTLDNNGTGYFTVGTASSTTGAFDVYQNGASTCAGIFDSGANTIYGLTDSLPDPAGCTALGGYYKGLAIGGSSSGNGSPIFGVLNSSQSSNGKGHTALTIYDTNEVDTYNNTLDDGNGNAIVSSTLKVGGTLNASGTITQAGVPVCTTAICISTSTFNATGTANNYAMWNAAGNGLSPTSTIYQSSTLTLVGSDASSDYFGNVNTAGSFATEFDDYLNATTTLSFGTASTSIQISTTTGLAPSGLVDINNTELAYYSSFTSAGSSSTLNGLNRGLFGSVKQTGLGQPVIAVPYAIGQNSSTQLELAIACNTISNCVFGIRAVPNTSSGYLIGSTVSIQSTNSLSMNGSTVFTPGTNSLTLNPSGSAVVLNIDAEGVPVMTFATSTAINVTTTALTVNGTTTFKQTSGSLVTHVVIQAGANDVVGVTPDLDFLDNSGTEEAYIRATDGSIFGNQVGTTDNSTVALVDNLSALNGVGLSATGGIFWNAGSNWWSNSNTPDVGLTRLGVNTLRVVTQNGTSTLAGLVAKNISVGTSTTSTNALYVNGHQGFALSNVTTTSCGTLPSVSGSDNAGVITVGSGVQTSCTLSFATKWTVAPVCTESDNSVAVTGDISSVTTSSVTFSFSASLGSGLIYYTCMGNPN